MGADVLYRFEVPWVDGTTVTDARCAITSDVLSIETLRGKDSASQLTGRSSAGVLKALMRNEDGKYSFNNPAGVLYGQPFFRTGIPIQLSAGIMVASVRTWYVLWRGTLDALVPNIDSRHFMSASLTGLGDVARLAAANFNNETAIAPGADYTGNWIKNILLSLYTGIQISSDFNIGKTLTGTFFAETENILELIRQLEDTEMGNLYEDVLQADSPERTDNVDILLFGFADRYRRLTSSRSTVPQAVFSDSPGAGEIPILTVRQQNPLKEIYNRIQVEVRSTLLGGDVSPLMDGSTVSTGSGAASKTVSYTVGVNESRLLRVTVASNDNPGVGNYPTGVTYNGVALTLLAQADTATTTFQSVWYLVNPPSGTYDVVVTWPDSQLIFHVGIEDYYRVNQTTPWGPVGVNIGASYTPFVTVASGLQELVVDSVNNNSVAGVYLVDDGNNASWTVRGMLNNGAASRELGAPSVTASWVQDFAAPWIMIAASLKPDVTTSNTTVWTLDGETPTLAPGEWKTFTAQYPNPASGSMSAAFVWSWVTPVAGTDILNEEGGTVPAALLITAVKRPRQMSITLKNDGKKGSITLGTISARAVVYTLGEPTLITVQDQISIDKYGLRPYKLPARWLADTDQARHYANYVLSRYKDPNHLLTLTFVASKTDAAMDKAVLLRLGDRVTVEANGNAGLGISEDFYIENISHRIDQGNTRHIVTYELSAVAGNGAYWILGTGVLGTSTKLGY